MNHALNNSISSKDKNWRKKFKITEITSQGNCSTKKTPLMTLYTLNMKKVLGRIMEESTDEDYVIFGWP